MANDLSGRQWRLDTAVAFGSAGAVIWKGNVKIKDAVFSGYTPPATAILKDGAGRIVGEATGAAGLDSIRMGEIGWVKGLCFDTLSGGGVVVVYVR